MAAALSARCVNRHSISLLILLHPGRGSFGKVRLAKNRDNGELVSVQLHTVLLILLSPSQVAIKEVSKSTISTLEDMERVYRETFIVRCFWLSLIHTHITIPSRLSTDHIITSSEYYQIVRGT